MTSDMDRVHSQFDLKYRPKTTYASHLTAIGKNILVKPREDNKFDTIAYLIHCPKHSTIAVYDDPNGFKWLPFTPLVHDKSWTESALRGTLMILDYSDEEFQIFKAGASYPFTSMQLVEILRIQLPQTSAFLTRKIFYLKMKEDPENDCCTRGKEITWISLTDLDNGRVNNLWGPELVQYSRQIANNFEDFIERIEEFSLDDVYKFSPREPPRNAEETMLSDVDISEKTIEILYDDFLDHCYPCFSLPIDSFKQYLKKFGLHNSDERLNSLFVAFNYRHNGYISFHELLLGLASLEPSARHSDSRAKFIFRFYDTGHKGYFDWTDYSKLVADTFPELEEAELNDKLDECLLAVGADPSDRENVQVSFGNLMTAIGKHQIQGTSKLCRSSVPVFLQLTRAAFRRKKFILDPLGKEWNDLSKVIVPRTYKGECKKCLDRKPRLATHSVNVNLATGYIDKPLRITSVDTIAAPVDSNSVEVVFNPSSVPNQLISLIRQFNEHKGTVEEPNGLLQEEGQKMLDLLVKLFTLVEPILKQESRCPNASSPCIVIGDIHGNLEDLLTMEKILWRHFPCIASNYLFLGDYVDRGKWGLECAMYLLSMKALNPQKITLLRGNHEVRSLQEKYTYKNECLSKYGPELGVKIWQLTNQMFDLLPVAATVDNSIFCVHGGLSPNAPTLEDIRQLPSPLEEPQPNLVAWELLWSDPCHMQQYQDIMEMTEGKGEFAQQGYLYNQKRGAAYLFNEQAASTFLSGNGLSHMIRAHEVPPNGFTQHFNNLCTTVFSCSHYCNYENEAACIILDNNRIRAVRIDTQNNLPATDK